MFTKSNPQTAIKALQELGNKHEDHKIDNEWTIKMSRGESSIKLTPASYPTQESCLSVRRQVKWSITICERFLSHHSFCDCRPNRSDLHNQLILSFQLMVFIQSADPDSTLLAGNYCLLTRVTRNRADKMSYWNYLPGGT